jgi:hypothetical protein
MRPDGAQVTVEVTLRRRQHLDGARFTSGPRYPTRGRRGTVTSAGAACACTGSRIQFPGEAGKEIIIYNDLCVSLSPAHARHDLEVKDFTKCINTTPRASKYIEECPQPSALKNIEGFK